MGLAGAAAAAGVAVSAGTAIAGAASGSGASGKAAQLQSDSADTAARLQSDQINATRAALEPYQHTGLVSLGYVPGLIGATGDNLGNPLTAPLTKFNYSGKEAPTWTDGFTAKAPTWDPTMAGLEATPGYQFSLQQGQKGVANSFAAKGLGSSGAAMKGAADYAQGLAANTYQQQFSNYNTEFQNYNTLFNQNQAKFGNFQQLFQNYLNQNTQDYAHQQQVYGMLTGLAGSGQNAAALTGSLAQAGTNSQTQLLTAGAAAQAAGTIGSANAWSQGLSNAGGALSQGGQLYALMKSGLLGGTGTTEAGSPFGGAGIAGTALPGSVVNTDYTQPYTGVFTEG